MGHRILFVGGTRSGKSALALKWAEQISSKRLFIATLEPADSEMALRVRRHKLARGTSWGLCEAGGRLCSKLARILDLTEQPGVILIDCLSTWVSTLIMDEGEDLFERELEQLASLLSKFSQPVGLVTTETGLGVVPPTPLGRRFRDALGDVNQRIARISDTVIFVSCGLPLVLKGEMPAALRD